ncbi:MAG TPA: DUF1501 domain-containing protein, partial [Armatimonadota bacterium]|nr:DUF1501 domain-containing protein [Armatimonadota bacterium]
MAHRQKIEDLLLTRREALQRCGTGFGALALAGLMREIGLTTPAQAAEAGGAGSEGGYKGPLAPKSPQFPARAKRVIHIFANGGPSHVDTWDPKPMLDKYHGQPLPMGNRPTERKTGAAFRSPFKFQKYGQCGLEV